MDNISLADKAKGNMGKGKTESSQKGEKKKKDICKIMFFHFHEVGNYATKCPNQNKRSSKNHAVASIEVDGFASQFEKYLSLITCMESLVGRNT